MGLSRHAAPTARDLGPCTGAVGPWPDADGTMDRSGEAGQRLQRGAFREAIAARAAIGATPPALAAGRLSWGGLRAGLARQITPKAWYGAVLCAV